MPRAKKANQAKFKNLAKANLCLKTSNCIDDADASMLKIFIIIIVISNNYHCK